MQYAQGKVGRVFVARVEHGDDLLAELKKLAEQESIQAGIFYTIGAMKEASLVAGPKACTRPPETVWRHFDDCREIIGIGTIFEDNGVPALHLHGTLGKGDIALMGCLRGESEVYLVVEVIILELLGTGAIRKFDAASELKMLSFIK
ncbi:PPC domain-containing DNA-binding protein [Desulfoscipio gibsoniae]|uniref:Putative DNA-binding protein with PD1-like DNA-binding motif n=1 Tax=Desulfoscipio gibsoniae DSM 7213 TaxID=767817 RepID=R4KK78_9FIRM|nr:PPC domain-containing DNA-binding protein [Desulfoscipio gibsoniae]AGL03044.1 putative DNA-binding protein with PD1-like DNA-binding motif [Desulfoscipio gibsoniae DSM 7213]